LIYTVTLNPSLDRTVEVEELVYDDVNTIVDERISVGGKGIDVSRVLKELGTESVALGFVGGYNGLELEGRLVSEGIVCNFTHVNNETKTNAVIYQQKKKLQTLLSRSGPQLFPHEIATFFNRLKEVPKGSYVVISGGVPHDIRESFFAQLITTLKERGVKAVLDTDGEPLRQSVSAGPYLIKPNIHEFGRLLGKNVTEIDEIVEGAKAYLGTIEYIVVSMGAKGVVGISRHGVYHAVPPKVKVRSSTGAGDSLVAGIVFVLSAGGNFEEAVTMGAACGTASTLNPVNYLCKKEDVAIIRKDVIVKKI
jgi:6-phosphofructokinase 2